MIKVGDTLPAVKLMEYSEVEGAGCSLGPNPVDVIAASSLSDLKPQDIFFRQLQKA